MNLDLEVAEKVMGWRTPEAVRDCYVTQDEEWRHKHSFSPSTDLQASFSVIHEMAKKGFVFSLWFIHGSWAADFSKSDMSCRTSLRKTPMEAICAAALELFK